MDSMTSSEPHTLVLWAPPHAAGGQRTGPGPRGGPLASPNSVLTNLKGGYECPCTTEKRQRGSWPAELLP